MPLRNVARKPQDVWEALQEGNRRLVTGTALSVNDEAEYRARLARGQDPRVLVLSCSDSRAPFEHVFNIGFGDAFVVRTAGHILDNAVLASIDYALENLQPNLLVVMGHQNCGAVAAAASFLSGESELPTGLQRPIIEKVAFPALAAMGQGRGTTADFERENVRQTVAQLLDRVPLCRELLAAGKLGIVGARYLLDDSSVEPIVLHGVH